MADLKPWDASQTGEVELGRGANGTVRLYRNTTTNTPVAVKVFTLPPNDLQRLGTMYSIREEAKYLSRFGSEEFFPSYLGCLDIGSDQAAIAMEFVGDQVTGETTTIRKLLERDQPHLRKEEVLEITLDILTGFYMLHNNSTLINDFKDDNVLIYQEKMERENH